MDQSAKVDAEPEDFGYFRDENDESTLKFAPVSTTTEIATSRFVSLLRRWWTESLWPGMGLFGESYLLFSIGTLTPIWKELYPDCWAHNAEAEDISGEESSTYYSAFENYTARNKISDGFCPPRLLESLTCGVVLGVIFGMVILGYWSNHIGRRKGSIFTASLMAGGSLGLVAISILGPSFWSAEDVFRGTVACLVLFGIGVGGEYPLSASLASEKATEELARNQNILSKRKENSHIDESSKELLHHSKWNGPHNRGKRVQLVFAMQGMGIWFNSLTMLVLLWALTGRSNGADKNDDTLDEDFEYSKNALLILWRVTYGIGGLVLCFVLLTRICYLEESKVWLEANKSNDTSQSNQTTHFSALNHNRVKLLHKQYGSRMFGAGMAWLLWDISFYGNKLFQSTFLLALVGENAGLTELTGAAALNATVALLGYYGAAVLIDLPRLGRKSLQSIGLVTTGLLFFACGLLASSASPGITVTLYLISSFVGQLGPNCTTFLIPAEIVPTDQRTYCHGVCAASGKIGALIAAVIFHFVGTGDGGAFLFYLCGFAGVLGAAVTFLFVPETAGLDLLELDLQWNLLLEGQRSYDGPAANEAYLSPYERYLLREKNRSPITNEMGGIVGTKGNLS